MKKGFRDNAMGSAEEQQELDVSIVAAKEPPKEPRTRKGRHGVVTYLNSDAFTALGQIALDHDKSKTTLMQEAVMLLFKEYGRVPR